MAPGKLHENMVQRNSKDGINHSTDPSTNQQEDVSVRKREAGDGADTPRKRMRCNNLTGSTEHHKVSVEDSVRSGKRKTTDPSPALVLSCWLRSGKRKVDNGGDNPSKRARCSSTDASEPTELSREDTCVANRQPSGDSEISSKSSSVPCTELKEDEKTDDLGDISHIFENASHEEEKVYEISSSASTSRDDFEDKYLHLHPIGAGGFGSVNAGFRRSDWLPVAIKHIHLNNVRFERVLCNGKMYNVILEVALMLKAAGLPGEVGQSPSVSLLDWYSLDNELLLVMERPVSGKDLWKYLQTKGGFLEEHEAKMILKELVDAAIDLHSKGVFHQDIKLQNVLMEFDSDEPRVRLIDFGCGTFSTEDRFHTFCGTPAYMPPECFDYRVYYARLTTVWQLGALFYSLLRGHRCFTTMDFIHNNIQINRALSTDVRLLIHTCLARDPMERATLEDLQRCPALQTTSSPPSRHDLNSWLQSVLSSSPPPPSQDSSTHHLSTESIMAPSASETS